MSINRYGRHEASGLAWDGEALWILVGDLLSRLARSIQPACSLALRSGSPQLDWAGRRGLAWDGQSLWVGHTQANKAYRLDPVGCE